MSLPCPERRVKIVNSDRGLKILARAVYRKFKTNNLSRDEILKIINEILGLLTADIKSQQ